MKNVSGLMIFLLSMVLSSFNAFTCSCRPEFSPQTPILLALDQSSSVFLGKVLNIEIIERDSMNHAEDILKEEMLTLQPDVRVTFKVLSAWKGQISSHLVLETWSTGSCGYDFKIGRKYLVYSHGKEASICSRTKAAKNASGEMQILEAVTKGTQD